jgi:hypothetical protein
MELWPTISPSQPSALEVGLAIWTLTSIYVEKAIGTVSYCPQLPGRSGDHPASAHVSVKVIYSSLQPRYPGLPPSGFFIY